MEQFEMNKNKAVALIPARSGSKRIVNKISSYFKINRYFPILFTCIKE